MEIFLNAILWSNFLDNFIIKYFGFIFHLLVVDYMIEFRPFPYSNQANE